MKLINKYAADRIKTNELSGPVLLSMFEGLQLQMETMGAEGNFVQYQFVGDPEELQDGDLIPELHLSLRRYIKPDLESDNNE